MGSLAGSSVIRTGGFVKAVLIAMPAVGWPTMAAACTLCDSAFGIAIRARWLAPGLWLQAGAVFAPLVLLALMILLAAREPRKVRR